MAVQPFYSPRFRAFDSSGNPLAGGLLYTYAAGTTTPQATYTTSAGDVANANPVVLDASGEATIWMTEGVEYKFELRSSAGVVQWTVDNVSSSASSEDEEAVAGSTDVAMDPGGRLSLTSGTSLTTTDVSASTTVYYVPHRHNKVPLYNGTGWALHSITTELSQTTSDSTKSPATVANSSCYDLFVWSDEGILRLSRGPAWTSDTARGTGVGTTELERKDGRWVNKVSVSNGPAAQRGLYVGTVRSDGSAQINDTLAKRHVWNLYNQEPRPMLVAESTDSWSYSSSTIRQARGSTANQLDVVVGLAIRPVSVRVDATAMCDVSVPADNKFVARALIGVDSVTVDSSQQNGPGHCLQLTGIPGINTTLWSTYRGFPGIGRHYFAWLEQAQTGGSAINFYGDGGGSLVSSGISGVIDA